MFAYNTIGSTNFEASVKFFDAVLATLGHARVHDYSEVGWIAYGAPGSGDDPNAQSLWLCKKPFNEQAATAGNGSMMALRGTSKAQVDQFHATALANGGSSEGAPGIREAYGPDFYIAYVRDPMGNKFSCVYRGL